jgi:hypothetical protein
MCDRGASVGSANPAARVSNSSRLRPFMRPFCVCGAGLPLGAKTRLAPQPQEFPMKTLMFLAALFVSTSLLVPTVSVAQPLFF